MNKKTLIAIVVGAVLFVFAVAAISAWGVYTYAKNNLLEVTAPAVVYPTEEEVADDAMDETGTPVAVTEEDEVTNTERVESGASNGVTWLEPIAIESPLLLNEEVNNLSTGSDYYKIGELVDGRELIVLQYESLGITSMYFTYSADGTYALLANLADEYTRDSADRIFVESVEIDNETNFTELENPAVLTVGDLQLQKTFAFSHNVFLAERPEYESKEEVLITDYGTVYKMVNDLEVNGESTGIQAKFYILVSADTTITVYNEVKPFLNDDGTLQLDEVTDNSMLGRSFTNGITLGGCGAGGTDHLLGSGLSGEDLTLIGTKDGRGVYVVSSRVSAAYDAAYESYTLGRSAENGNAPMSRADFDAAAPVLAWLDPAGDYIGLIDIAYAPNVECGKPVVYLYPEVDTHVTVEVDANVTISEPAYNSGWSVLAQPNGQLINRDGLVYGSLYWEGKGFGEYPAITQGRVIESQNFEAEVRADMTQLGLNQQEQDDFMEFWQDYIPKQPYTRLTWLGTQEMEALAPLHVSPKPDTLQRVFLDFAGQDSANTDLQPQALRSFERKGFTVVEWGGLLVGGLKK